MFMILVGSHPFYKKGDSRKKLREKICEPKWVFPENLDSFARDLFLKLVAPVPSQRYYASQVLAHPFITQTNSGIPLTNNQLTKALVAQKSMRSALQTLFLVEAIRLKDQKQRETPKKWPASQKDIENIEKEQCKPMRPTSSVPLLAIPEVILRRENNKEAKGSRKESVESISDKCSLVFSSARKKTPRSSKRPFILKSSESSSSSLYFFSSKRAKSKEKGHFDKRNQVDLRGSCFSMRNSTHEPQLPFGQKNLKSIPSLIIKTSVKGNSSLFREFSANRRSLPKMQVGPV